MLAWFLWHQSLDIKVDPQFTPNVWFYWIDWGSSDLAMGLPGFILRTRLYFSDLEIENCIGLYLESVVGLSKTVNSFDISSFGNYIPSTIFIFWSFSNGKYWQKAEFHLSHWCGDVRSVILIFNFHEQTHWNRVCSFKLFRFSLFLMALFVQITWLAIYCFQFSQLVWSGALMSNYQQ